MSAYLYTVDYNNIKNIQEFTSSSRRTSTTSSAPSTKAVNNTTNSNKFTMKSALNQLKPTEEQIHPSGIYTPIIKRGSLFSGLRRSSKSNTSTPSSSPSQSRKHSATEARADSVMLMR